MKFTLITATLNAAATLERAIASAAGQAADVEHLVIDGGSHDRTVEICRAHPSLRAIVDPGCSIYAAWNIGVEAARGDVVLFLNADDELAPDALRTVEDVLRRNADADIVAGRAEMIDSDRPSAPPVVMVAAPDGRLDSRQLALGIPAINAMAFRRSVFVRHGRFETVYRAAGDRAFLLRLAQLPTPPAVASTDAFLYRYVCHDGSLTLRRNLRQRLMIANEHMALATALLGGEIDASAARVFRYWRRREAAAAAVHCLAARRPVAALGFASRFVWPSRIAAAKGAGPA